MLRLTEAAQEAIDPLDLYLGDERGVADRPWVMLNMIASLDGATAVGGGATALGDEDDRAAFQAIRAVPDVILVGAGTVTAEDYGPVSLDQERRERRAALGKVEVPTLAIVTGRMSIEPGAKVFSDPEHKPLIITSTNVSPGKLVTLGDAADVVFLEDLTPEAILGQLGAAEVVLLEGGPTLNGQFARDGLIDEINLTIAPTVHAGDSKRVTVGPEVVPPLSMRQDRVLFGDRSLFVRYLSST